MLFEARELKPYAETVAAVDLVEGSVYFSVQFLDEEGLIPIMEPLVFIGRNLKTSDAGRVYLQDFGSFQRGVRYPEAGTEGRRARYDSCPEDRAINLHDFESALNELLACSLRRRETTR
jgi:hypothetical protein